MPEITNKDIQQNTQLLEQASQNGDAVEVKRLIPISDPRVRNSVALRWAAGKGHTEIVELLIPVSDCNTMYSYALRGAAQHGHIECVKLLIPVSDPKANDSEALQLAVRSKHREIAKCLIPVSDYTVALQNMLHHNEDTTLIQQCIDEYEALQQKERLDNTLVETIDNKHKSAKRKM